MVSTVKQPLPLPQGVSDYAVGYGMRLGTALAPLMARKEAPAAPEQKTNGEQTSPKEADKRRISIGEITVTGGLSKDEVLSFLQNKIQDLENCSRGKELSGKLVIELVISPDGKVRTAKIASSPLKTSSVERCLTELAHKWQFPAAPDGQDRGITISFELSLANG